MQNANLPKADRLVAQLDEYNDLLAELQQPCTLILKSIATESAGPKNILVVADDNDELRPFVKNKKDAFVQNLITHFTTRIAEIETEIETL